MEGRGGKDRRREEGKGKGVGKGEKGERGGIAPWSFGG